MPDVDVAVGGTDVAVGGTDVAVGGTDVLVGSGGVFVGGGSGVCVGPTVGVGTSCDTCVGVGPATTGTGVGAKMMIGEGIPGLTVGTPDT